MRDTISIARHFIRSPRAFLATAREAAARLDRPRPARASGGGPPLPVDDDLPNVRFPNVTVVEAPATLDVLIPGLQERYLSGGPNTALNLTWRVAAAGVPVRLVSTDLPHDDEASLRRHCAAVSGIDERLDNVSFASFHDRSRPAPVGSRDMLLGTAWWTAHYARRILAQTRRDTFLYLVQDYEPGFYKWSCEHALALETYAMPMRAVVCGTLLAEFLREREVGQFADPAFADSSLVFEPAIDRERFHADEERLADRGASPDAGKRRLLFYARPDTPRNLFEIGLLALRDAVARGAFAADAWELWFLGGDVAARDLGRGAVVRQHPWLDYDGYAALLRSCDVGLSLMLSPHTSYPPLEMAACGATVVTNTFANKTAARLRAYSGNILPVAPTAGAVTEGLLAAHERADDVTARRAGCAVAVPASWDEAFVDVVPALVDIWEAGAAAPA